MNGLGKVSASQQIFCCEMIKSQETAYFCIVMRLSSRPQAARASRSIRSEELDVCASPATSHSLPDTGARCGSGTASIKSMNGQPDPCFARSRGVLTVAYSGLDTSVCGLVRYGALPIPSAIAHEAQVFDADGSVGWHRSHARAARGACACAIPGLSSFVGRGVGH